MPITLVSDTEKFSYQVGDSTIYYRRVPSHIQKGYEKRHTKRGEVDTRSVLEDILSYSVLDWDNVVDTEGNQIPFSKDKLSMLPESVKVDLISLFYEADTGQAELGN